MGEVSLVDGHIDNEDDQIETIKVDGNVVKYIESRAIKRFAEALKKRIKDKYPVEDSDVLCSLVMSEISYYADCFTECSCRMPDDYTFETGI